MVEIDVDIILDAIQAEIEQLKGMPGVDPSVIIDKECKPGAIGIRSQVLVTIMGRLEEILEIEIPNNCYIFRDKDGITELKISEAAKKLKQIAKPCKTTT